MPSTNKTDKFKLSQFEPTDKSSFIQDYNADMRTIDTALSMAEWGLLAWMRAPTIYGQSTYRTRAHFPCERPIGPPSPEDGDGYYLKKRGKRHLYAAQSRSKTIFNQNSNERGKQWHIQTKQQTTAYRSS